jgi:hypothetical protein
VFKVVYSDCQDGNNFNEKETVMEVLLRNQKFGEKWLTQCRGCESILSELAPNIVYAMPCPVCKTSVFQENWCSPGYKEYNQLMTKVKEGIL